MRTQQIGVVEVLNVRLAFSLSRSICASLVGFLCKIETSSPKAFFFSGQDRERARAAPGSKPSGWAPVREARLPRC